jgi:hypothetical protein
MRESAGPRQWTGIVDLALATRSAARVGVRVEAKLIDGNLNACIFVHPCGDISERSDQKVRGQLLGVNEGEVQIFRKSICLEVAFLEAGASLEYPIVNQGGLGINTSHQPSKNIILLYNIWKELQICSNSENFTPVDHVTVPRFHRAAAEAHPHLLDIQFKLAKNQPARTKALIYE